MEDPLDRVEPLSVEDPLDRVDPTMAGPRLHMHMPHISVQMYGVGEHTQRLLLNLHYMERHTFVEYVEYSTIGNRNIGRLLAEGSSRVSKRNNAWKYGAFIVSELGGDPEHGPALKF